MSDLGPSGAKLWSSIADDFELEAHEEGLLLQLCRTADVLDALAARIALDGAVLPTGKPHPALSEHRAQAVTYARLRAALRLPEEDGDAEARPQRRGGARGIYGIA